MTYLAIAAIVFVGVHAMLVVTAIVLSSWISMKAQLRRGELVGERRSE